MLLAPLAAVALLGACTAVPVERTRLPFVDDATPSSARLTGDGPAAARTLAGEVLRPDASRDDAVARGRAGEISEPAVSAADVRPDGHGEPGADAWAVSFTPYFWAANVEGHAKIRGRRLTVDADFFSDTLEDIQLAAQGTLELRRDDVAFVLDTTFLELGVDGEAGQLDVDVEGDVWLVQGHVTRNLTEDGTLAAYAGVRYWDVDVEADLSPGPTLDGNQGWYDPLVGLRKTWPISDDGTWHLVTFGDVGGGGFGDWASEFAWQAAVLAQRRWECGDLLLGYRAVYSHYENGSGTDEFENANTWYGPVVGWRFRF